MESYLKLKLKIKPEGIIYNLIGAGAPMVMAIMAIPALVKAYGNDGFAIISMLWVAMGYFAFLEFGLPRVIAAKISLSNNEDEIRLVVSNGIVGCLIISTVCLLSLVISAALFNFDSEIKNIKYREMLTYLIISLPAILITGVYRGIAEGKLNFLDSNILKFFSAATMYLAPTICAIYEKEFKVAIISIALAKVIVAVGFYYKYIARNNLFNISLVNFSIIFNYYKYGGWITLAAASGPIMVYGDRFVITGLVEMSELGVYSVAMELVTKIWILPIAITTAIFPVLVKNNRLEAGWKIIEDAKLLNTIGMAIILISYYMVGDYVLNKLLGNLKNDMVIEIISILIVGIYVNSFAHYSFTNLQASQRAKTTAFIHLLQLPLYFLMVGLFVYFYSIVGAAYAWTLNLVINYIILEIYNYKKYILKKEAIILFLSPLVVAFVLITEVLLVEKNISKSISISILSLSIVFSSYKLFKTKASSK